MGESCTRRNFIKKSSIAATAMSFGFSAKSYSNIIGANERLNVAVKGTNNRGNTLAEAFIRQKNTAVLYICDPVRGAREKGVNTVSELTGKTPQSVEDFRSALEDDALDALIIASPDHWHTPAGILACDAGKHVYIEKPLGHNAREGELLVEASKKYRKIIQVGTQRRSWPRLKECIEEIRNGVIGRVYFAKGWYANRRSSIGRGQHIPVPAGLNYELWQGPAPRTPYQDNIIHYNWHWFWNWGTGEALNNGNHEMDVMRWGLDVDFPMQVNSIGGMYHFKDDWQTPDTQVVGINFPNEKTMVWEGRSRNSRYIENSSRGIKFHGENGTIVIPGGNSYKIYDNDNKLVRSVDPILSETSDTLDDYHVQDFLSSIRNENKPSADVVNGHKSALLGHLGNIAQKTGRALKCDSSSGRIIDDAEAMKLWGRDYEPGWEPIV